jgi:photosystem II cytochrome c550
MNKSSNINLITKVICTAFVTFSLLEPAQALDLDDEVRTTKLDSQGETIVLSLEQLKRGKRLFSAACGPCHVAGLTKPNPNVGLDSLSLQRAVPPRDNIVSLVEFLKSPKSYDGRYAIGTLHPCIEYAELFTKMRSFTESDLVAISGHILFQSKVLGERWGGGKIYY